MKVVVSANGRPRALELEDVKWVNLNIYDDEGDLISSFEHHDSPLKVN